MAANNNYMHICIQLGIIQWLFVRCQGEYQQSLNIFKSYILGNQRAVQSHPSRVTVLAIFIVELESEMFIAPS